MRSSLRSLALLSLIAGALTACDSDDPTSPGAGAPRLLSAVADSNPWNTISAVVTVVATGADSAFIRYWSGTTQPASTPSFAVDDDVPVRIPVLGLDTALSHSLEVVLVGGIDTVIGDTLTFVTGQLPAWIPAAGVQGTDTTPGLFLISYPDGPVIINNQGKVLWYRLTPGGVLNSFMAHPNGTYSSLSTADSSGHVIFNVLGDTVGRVGCQGYKTRFHDILIAADGVRWLMCDDARIMDLSGVGGVPGAVVTGTVVQRQDPSGQVTFEWNAFDHFAITDQPLQDRTGPSVNFTHGNALALDLDGNLLVSFRSLNEITKINISSGAVMWRFGGLANEFTFQNDLKGSFARQHGLRPGAPGEIVFLDNGTAAPSRLVRYLLNQQALQATLVMQYIDPANIFATVGGATQYYPSNGHSVVTFGPAGRVVEVDPAGNAAWELTGVSGTYVFRVQRVASLYRPGVGDRR